ncbi:hypothetical protein ACIQH5_10985 [Paenarthrobacter sp. NPDC091711]|uniref:hypothetical protein n=1 Tax=Paenarthrobacter sp. NPDC091711 TaxID=3364385 RepID=UPI0038292B26
MARKPSNFEWIGFTKGQLELLDFLDFLGNNGWDRNGQTEELMPKLLADCAKEGLSIDQVMKAMMSIGYDRRAVHQIRRWESKRLTGKLGK